MIRVVAEAIERCRGEYALPSKEAIPTAEGQIRSEVIEPHSYVERYQSASYDLNFRFID